MVGLKTKQSYQSQVNMEDVSGLSQSLSGKMNTKNIVTDMSSTAKTISSVEANTNYHFGTLTNLTFTAIPSFQAESNVFFTSGASISVNFPASTKFIGSATFQSGKQYAISILNNTVVVGKIGE